MKLRLIKLLRWLLARLQGTQFVVVVYDVYREPAPGERGPTLTHKDVLYAFYYDQLNEGTETLIAEGASNIRTYSVADDLRGRLHVQR